MRRTKSWMLGWLLAAGWWPVVGWGQGGREVTMYRARLFGHNFVQAAIA